MTTENEVVASENGVLKFYNSNSYTKNTDCKISYMAQKFSYFFNAFTLI